MSDYNTYLIPFEDPCC